MNATSWVLGASAVVLIGIAVPLILRSVPPNRFYGFRVPATLNDERLWYDVNARAGVDMLLVGAGMLAIVGAGAAGVLSDRVMPLVALVWMNAGAIYSLAHGFVVIRRSRS